MTAEICLMNRHGAVLAADSAITATQFVGNRQRERYYKGANKIFQLSEHQPVALMLHGTASLHSIPWENLIKDFRRDLGRDTCPSLSGYAEKFFDFLRGHRVVSSDEFKSLANEAAVLRGAKALLELADTDEAAKRATTAPDRKAAFDAFFDRVAAVLDAEPPPPFVPQADYDAALVAHSPLAATIVHSLAQAWQLEQYVDAEKAARTVLRACYKRYTQVQPNTGLVFCGFGSDDYFPHLSTYPCRGLVLGHLAVADPDVGRVNLRNHAWVQPFAMSSMMETFAFGLSEAMRGALRGELDGVLRDFADTLVQTCGGERPPDLDRSVKEAVETFDRKCFDMAWKANGVPLREVIAALSLGELAELGETLISLESIKERMTQPSESVGGPVDVAALTRHEGFVWIKRKHYFDPALNPRYFERRSSIFRSRLEENS